MAEERLILVDESNRAVGIGGKTPCIARACCIAHSRSSSSTTQGRILLQRRSRQKYHSGGLWANSCCGHPRPGETRWRRRAGGCTEELGITAPLTFGFYSRYRAELDGGMQENEFVYVYFGPLTAQPESRSRGSVGGRICERRRDRAPHCAPAGRLRLLAAALFQEPRAADRAPRQTRRARCGTGCRSPIPQARAGHRAAMTCRRF